MNEIAIALDRMLAQLCPTAWVRAVDRGASSGAFWSQLEQSGYLDAMVPTSRDGGGLGLAQAFELFVLQGRYALPVPMAATMAERGFGSNVLPIELAAVVTAAQMVGALERVLDLTLAYANERAQFGRPIGKFQAIQHQLAIIAEQVAAARTAARIGCASDRIEPDPVQAAVAKSRVSEASAVVAPLAHAIHGAIGITAEMDLQLYTRRLHAWRVQHGSELYWNRRLGEALMQASDTRSLDFIRSAIAPH